MISKPLVRLAQTMHISCIDTNTVSKRKEVRLHMTHVTFGVPSGATKMIYEPMVCSMQTVHLSCTKISTICKRSKLSIEHHHLVAPSSASKMIYEPMVRLAQTMHQSCTNTNTVSKRKEARFHMTQVTYGFHRVCPKWFLSLWYVRHKPCNYLASRLAWSLNGESFHLRLVT